MGPSYLVFADTNPPNTLLFKQELANKARNNIGIYADQPSPSLYPLRSRHLLAPLP